MAAGNFTLYNSAIIDFFDGTQDWDTDSHYMILITSTYTPAGTHATLADISTNEVTDADYARQDLTTEAVTEPTAGTARCDADNVSFGASVTITAKYAAVLVGTVAGAASTDPVVGYVDLDTGGGSVSSTNGTFEVQWSANGLFEVSQA